MQRTRTHRGRGTRLLDRQRDRNGRIGLWRGRHGDMEERADHTDPQRCRLDEPPESLDVSCPLGPRLTM